MVSLETVELADFEPEEKEGMIRFLMTWLAPRKMLGHKIYRASLYWHG